MEKKELKPPKPIPGVLDTEVIETWQEVLKRKEELGLNRDRWIFRGQRDACWRLTTTFERAKRGAGKEPSWKYEAATLREFTRRAHHYLVDVPRGRDVLEWFALMRHFGAPSRILDCTYSFYVAAYFALKEATPNETLSAIWAINTSWLKAKFRERFPKSGAERGEDFRFKDPDDFFEYFLEKKGRNPAFVASVNPFRLNERITAQQGIFLCPGNIEKPFMTNLLQGADQGSHERVVRIVIDPAMKQDALRDLRRMNVTSSTLFPDLGGFAMYLWDWFYLPLNFTDDDLNSAIRGEFPGS